MIRAFVRLASTTIATALIASPAFAQGSKIDAADTAWMISATALVLMMTIPGLALFYAGMVRKKNVLATMAQSLAATFLVSILWAVVGYSLAFTGDGAFIGTFERIFLNGVTLDASRRWQDHSRKPVHDLPDDFRHHHGRAGRWLGRRSSAFFSVPAVLRFLAAAVYVPIAHWVWGGGFLGCQPA